MRRFCIPVSHQIARLREEGSRQLQEEQRLIREQIQREREEQEHRGAGYTYPGRLHYRELQGLTVRRAMSNPVRPAFIWFSPVLSLPHSSLLATSVQL